MNFQSSFFKQVAFFYMCFANLQVSAQSKPVPDFASPLEIPLLLSGNYGEIRSAHFHAGIDIKTEQVEGKKVVSVGDGYVVRVNVQGGGYGNALYVAHPDGYVTVYGHLREFTPDIAQYVKENQYRRKSFEVDLFPEAGHFTFKKGEMIGYSGNSGSSTGPHLHFEIRDQRNSVPLNVLHFNLPVRDDISPRIMWLAVYPLNGNGAVNGQREKTFLPVVLRDGKYVLADDKIPDVFGDIGFGIETYDFLNGAANRCSPYTVALAVDEHLISLYRLDSIPFHMTSYVDSHIDFEEKIRSGRVIQKFFVDPNNRLEIYKVLKNRGVLTFQDTLLHQVEIRVSDVYGNESVLSFSLQSLSSLAAPPVPVPVSQAEEKPAGPAVVSMFAWSSLNVFENEDVRVVVPENALFDNVLFQYERIAAPPGSISDTFCIHNEYIPLHTSCILSIRPGNLPERYRDKVMIASTDRDRNLISYGGTYADGFVTARLGRFGKFHLAIDTVSPLITPVSFMAGRTYSAGQTISFTITDEGSGIRRYSGYIDGEWSLFTYDPKQDLISYNIDRDRLVSSQSHDLEIIVTDQKDNVSHFRSIFYY